MKHGGKGKIKNIDPVFIFNSFSGKKNDKISGYVFPNLDKMTPKSHEAQKCTHRTDTKKTSLRGIIIKLLKKKKRNHKSNLKNTHSNRAPTTRIVAD